MSEPERKTPFQRLKNVLFAKYTLSDQPQTPQPVAVIERQVMKRLFLALCFCCFASATQAGPDSYALLLGSKHLGSSEFNEVNPGLFATWERKHSALSLGAYLNSHKRLSISATSYRPLARWRTGTAGLFGGIALYPENGRSLKTRLVGDVIFLGGVQITQGAFFAQIVPLTDRDSKGLLAFGLTFKAP